MSPLPLRARRGNLLPTEVDSWSTLRRQLRRTIDAPSTPKRFETIRARSAIVARYATADCLLAYLADDVGADLDTKGQLYTDLVQCAQARGPEAHLAYSLLWLGLWPGLSAAFVRRATFWRDAPNDLIAELTAIFTGIVARLNLSRVRCVIGTLVRSTERDVIRAGMARDQRAAVEVPTVRPEALCRPSPSLADDETRPEPTLVALAEAIRGREKDPAIQAAVCDLGPGHIAVALGIKPAAARKRLERARRWLRRELSQDRPGQPPARIQLAQGAGPRNDNSPSESRA